MSVVLGQVGQIRHGAHPVAFAQQGPPRQRHPGHLQHVLVLLDLLQAVGQTPQRGRVSSHQSAGAAPGVDASR
ncbi:hypothetical protein A5N15_03055 [Rothia kristinae]|uniref:Uncharacterized protein n=1 Tax=Rothia kristinae TaxID=37923 RepID=A0A657IVC5_9MICC|nr:hypothetical protein A5N15_03055 [Rothia kristinae]